MKIMTILGTRPEIIRLSRVIPVLDDLCDHVLVHTGQNYDKKLNDIFFEDLELRKPDHVFESKSEMVMEQVGIILSETEKVLLKEKPDRLLLLGDTNSALSAIVAKRMGIPVYHMEAGNRCFDDKVPEEVNRRIIDHCSDILLPYTERSRANLIREGIAGQKIYVTGNPIKEVIDYYAEDVEKSQVLETHGLKIGEYFLVTLHRTENVDDPERLASFIQALYDLHDKYGHPILCSLHPRTASQLEKQDITIDTDKITLTEPLGFFDFIKLEKNAFCTLSDSGTVQEECCIFQVPAVTLRDVTERPETIEVGSNILSGCTPESIESAVEIATRKQPAWPVPPEYAIDNVSGTIAKILLGYGEVRRD